jgi:hypothetical protein
MLARTLALLSNCGTVEWRRTPSFLAAIKVIEDAASLTR